MPSLITFSIGDRVDYNGAGDFTANPAGQYVIAAGNVALLAVDAAVGDSQYTHVQAVPATTWHRPGNSAPTAIVGCAVGKHHSCGSRLKGHDCPGWHI